jgi:threonylcarbamoyladenosine tRNA methylthiotransferase MtaB
MGGVNQYTIAISALGCKVNQAETDVLGRQLSAGGHRVVSFDVAADAYVLNTCTVTHVADRKTRQMLRQAQRRNPGALVVAMGCGASHAGDLAGLSIENNRREQAADLVLQALAGRPPLPVLEVFPVPPARTRAIVKAQDGCDHRCAYCIVPQARGPAHSEPASRTIEVINTLVAEGHKEVVLTGPQLGGYSDPEAGDLSGLVRAILRQTGVHRLRLSSIEPHSFPDSLLDLWPNPRLCRHLHLPLQSGCDTILSRMGRGYSISQYTKLAETIRHRVPGIAITTDVIVGFPGETEAQFAETEEFVAATGFARVHVFAYSPRPGTQAACWAKSPATEIRARRDRMLRLAELGSRSYRQPLVGDQVEVLFEERLADGLWAGLTDTYMRVYAGSDSDLSNQLRPVKLMAMHRDGVIGSIADAGNTLRT